MSTLKKLQAKELLIDYKIFAPPSIYKANIHPCQASMTQSLATKF
uniref:Uncharacterized protein n=1 Tax=Arundo donax TaxID=35708 RepID=A0A0A9G5S2_ARUDO